MPVTPTDIFKSIIPDVGTIDIGNIPAWWNGTSPLPGFDSNVTSAFGVPSRAAHLWYFRQVNGCDPKTKNMAVVWPPFIDGLY